MLGQPLPHCLVGLSPMGPNELPADPGHLTLEDMGLTTMLTSQAILPMLLILKRALAWWPTSTLQKKKRFSSSTNTPPLSSVSKVLLRLVLSQIWCSSKIRALLSVTKAAGGEWQGEEVVMLGH